MQKVLELIASFAHREDPPIDVQEVVDYLRKHEIKDEVNFIAAELNPEILRGQIVHFIIPRAQYREPLFCADIFYAKDQTRDWQRLVCCKELLHILDPEESRVKSREELRQQFEKIVLPAEFQKPLEEGEKVISDRIATYLAVAVLFPWSTRQILKPAYDADKLTVEDIGRIVDLPLRYVTLVMDDRWEEIHKACAPKAQSPTT